MRTSIKSILIVAAVALIPMLALAKDVKYSNGEIEVKVNPGEPTQVKFPGTISGGFMKSKSGIRIDRKGSDLIVFAKDNLPKDGEVLIVRIENGASYPLRIRRAANNTERDVIINIEDDRGDIIMAEDEEEPAYKEKTFQYAPPSKVSGLMREMALVAEFGKKAIPGYRVTDKYRGQTVLDDGNMIARIERIYLGPTLWGYEISTENRLNQSQKINPATFRLDGTRAISADRWELAPVPLNPEQAAAGKHVGRIYVITRAKK